jgi:hypothetical protein
LTNRLKENISMNAHLKSNIHVIELNWETSTALPQEFME